MATQIYKPKQPLNNVIQKWMDEAEEQLHHNLNTQFVWPVEVYPGYRQVNEYRRKHGGWYSTGEGERTLNTQVIDASSPGNVTVMFAWNYYMDFVDRGVGKGRPIEKVQRTKKAKFQNRYIGIWQPKGGATHRPALFMETRHMERRIQRYLEDFYGWEGSVRIVEAFDNLNINFDF